MSWGALFDRAAEYETTAQAIGDRRATLSKPESVSSDSPDGDTAETGFRVVADADVLAADILADGTAREALDDVRRHSWVHLVASDYLLAQAKQLIAEFGSSELAREWRETIEHMRRSVDHPPGDHPALASAYRGGARQLLTLDGELTGTGANLSLQSHMSISISTPDAFVTVFDPEPVYETRFEEPYPGPDNDPRGQ